MSVLFKFLENDAKDKMEFVFPNILHVVWEWQRRIYLGHVLLVARTCLDWGRGGGDGGGHPPISPDVHFHSLCITFKNY